MAKYICLAFKPFSTPTRLCSQALSAFPAHSPLPRSNSKGFLCCLCSCLCSLPGPQAPVLSSLPGLPGLSISQEGEQAECALSLLASVPQRPPNILSSGCSVCHAQSLGPGVWLGLAVYSSHLLMGMGSVPSHRDGRCSTRCLSHNCHNCQPLRDVCKLSQSLWGWLGVGEQRW